MTGGFRETESERLLRQTDWRRTERKVSRMATNPCRTDVYTLPFDVLDGPNADRVLDAFKYAYSDSGDKVAAKFSLQCTDSEPQLGAVVICGILREEISAQITAVRYESGSPGMFSLSMRISEVIIGGLAWDWAEGFYNANARKGYFHLYSAYGQ